MTPPVRPDSEAPTTLSETPPSTNVPLTEPVTPTPPVVPATDPLVLTAYNGLIAEQNQTNAALRRELDELRNKVNAPPALTAEQERDSYFANPATMIRQEVAAAIAPLNAFAAETRRENAYNSLKSQMKLDPRFTRLGEFEAQFDNVMRSSTVVDANTMVAAYYSIFGHLVATGALSATPASATTTTPSTPATPPVVNPPHLRPTQPSSAAPAPVKKHRELTENERRVARLNKLTDEEYLAGLEGSFNV